MRDFTALSPLLRNLCDNAPWNYSVFWKLNYDRNMILTWEDGYFYDAYSRAEPAIVPIRCIRDEGDGVSGSFPIRIALERMMNHVYLMGEGIVGKAAIEKRHYWVFTEEVNYDLLFEHYEDRQLQLAAGIKTILIVPIGNYGVVQVGSLNMVMEDIKMVVDIRDLFSNFYSEKHSSINSFVDCSSISSPAMQPTGLFVPHNSSKHFSSLESDLFSVMDGLDLLSSPNHLINDYFSFDTSRFADETDLALMYNNQQLGLIDESNFGNNSSGNFAGDMSNRVFSKNETETDAQVNCRSNSKQLESLFGNQDGWYSLSDANATLFQEIERDYTDGLLAQEYGELSNIPIDMNLHNSCFFNMTIPKASTITKGSEFLDFSFGENHSGNLKDCHGDDLLEAVVGSFRCQSNNTPENTSEKLSSNSSEKLESSLTQSTNEFSIFEFGNLLSASQKGSISDVEGITSSLATSLKSSNQTATERKPDSKKLRRESGEKHKPRPRDRQLIQDRIKELRGLIPNGSSCSIDALLDKTVRHMMFLGDISAHAEKLRQTEDRKVKGEVYDSMKPGNYPNGASWAYEVGSKPANFPLIIENLDQPGQILVEMMCKDYGSFLEIAHVIRHQDLMILKGVLETRLDKLWAHFVIEVSKDFQRTRILWPLMQLVQQNYKC